MGILTAQHEIKDQLRKCLNEHTLTGLQHGNNQIKWDLTFYVTL